MKQKMLIIGLTGGIGMGKSTAAKILRGFGLPIHNADKVVHNLLKKHGAGVGPVSRLFPEALQRGVINRKKVGQLVFGNPLRLQQLEKVLHPLVRKAEHEFLKKAQTKKARAVVLEIPLLFETNSQKRCDFTICVTASRTIQKQRVLERRHMTEARFRAILKRQMADEQKRKLADYVVQTGKGLADTKQQLKQILAEHKLD